MTEIEVNDLWRLRIFKMKQGMDFYRVSHKKQSPYIKLKELKRDTFEKEGEKEC